MCRGIDILVYNIEIKWENQAYFLHQKLQKSLIPVNLMIEVTYQLS